jgi:HNH endonuclease
MRAPSPDTVTWMKTRNPKKSAHSAGNRRQKIALESEPDHIIPLSRGGPKNERWNYKSLHRDCNRKKGNSLTPQAIALAETYGIALREPKSIDVEKYPSGKPWPEDEE